MKIYLTVFLLCFGWSMVDLLVQSERISERTVVKQLVLSNKFHDAGDWGPQEFCKEGSYVDAVEVNFQAPSNLDETAINAIKLYCKDMITLVDTGYLQSLGGDKGEWYGMQICPDVEFQVGFRGKVLKYQGIFTDDVALQDLEVRCENQTIVDALPGEWPKQALNLNKNVNSKDVNDNDVNSNDVNDNDVNSKDFKEGTWSQWALCDAGTAICGLQTRYEDGSLGDETAVCDVVLFCCSED